MECFQRKAKDLWILQNNEGLDMIANIENLAINIPLVDIYANIDFNPTENEENIN